MCRAAYVVRRGSRRLASGMHEQEDPVVCMLKVERNNAMDELAWPRRRPAA